MSIHKLMDLIIDNGGTKAIWILTEGSEIVDNFTTSGIYPPLSKDEAIINYFLTGKERYQSFVDRVFFYSTGCRPSRQKERVGGLLRNVFTSNQIEVQTDVLAAARALCGRKPGIACIMGTGSNSCLYDGKAVLSNQGGYGFILGDEGSGAALGKQILQHFIYNTLPDHLKKTLEESFKLTVEEILLRVYQNDKPNKYLASFAPFIHQYRSDPFILSLLKSQFQLFFERCVIVYPEYQQYPVHFLGSIAHYFKEELRHAAKQYDIQLESFSRDPMPGLVKYHAT